MATNNISEGVGKKIVEALKMQASGQSGTDSFMEELSVSDIPSNDIDLAQDSESMMPNASGYGFMDDKISYQAPSIDAAFEKSLAQNYTVSENSNIADDYEYPANVAILKQLIAKLPAGVSKQTGAIIIKQTMEALGIPMSSVLQEAKQVQATLINNSKECQTTIADYRKQIEVLEAKSQLYQKQSVAMAGIINLFLHTN